MNEDPYVQKQSDAYKTLFAKPGKRYCERCGNLLKSTDAYLCARCEVEEV